MTQRELAKGNGPMRRRNLERGKMPGAGTPSSNRPSSTSRDTPRAHGDRSPLHTASHGTGLAAAAASAALP